LTLHSTTSMKALIIYDDLTGATRATAALKRAALRANVGADWDIKPWRTDALKFPSVADRALIEAADADLIVFAGPQAHSLPTWLEEWLRGWAVRRDVEDAALAVIQQVSAGVSLVAPAVPQLRRFAAFHGLSFIIENETTPEDQTPSILHAPSARRWPILQTSESPVPVLDPSSYRDLGIRN
jgi:hypothetical protein